MSRENSLYPSTFYRVSLKAIIRDESGRVLVTKEDDFAWSFPGGGIEHGETEEEALRRELKEEVLIDVPYDAKPIGVGTYYVDHKDAWALWVFYEVVLPDGFVYGNGDNVTDTQFMDPEQFKDSDNAWERIVYQWGRKAAS